jgi:hypothetical protein
VITPAPTPATDQRQQRLDAGPGGVGEFVSADHHPSLNHTDARSPGQALVLQRQLSAVTVNTAGQGVAEWLWLLLEGLHCHRSRSRRPRSAVAVLGARGEFERALEIAEAALGPDHPSVDTMRRNLGRLP